jgi:hypothetical protein
LISLDHSAHCFYESMYCSIKTEPLSCQIVTPAKLIFCLLKP